MVEVPPPLESKHIVLDSLNKQKKYFLLHTNGEVYGMDNILIDTSTITGSPVQDVHSLYLNPHKHFILGPQRTYYKSESGVINEVHLYATNNVQFVKDTFISVPIKSIDKIEIIEHDKKKTNSTNTFGIVVLAAATVGLIVLFVEMSSWEF
jgi:hypothetical protein